VHSRSSRALLLPSGPSCSACRGVFMQATNKRIGWGSLACRRRMITAGRPATPKRPVPPVCVHAWRGGGHPAGHVLAT
jgi:hypothetical protein